MKCWPPNNIKETPLNTILEKDKNKEGFGTKVTGFVKKIFDFGKAKEEYNSESESS